jgi:hypothetical protein
VRARHRQARDIVIRALHDPAGSRDLFGGGTRPALLGAMKSTKTRLVLAMAMAFALPLGCGDDGDDDGDNQLDERQAQTSWSAANHAAASAHSDFAANVVLGQHGDISIACDGGGLLHVAGTMNETHDFDLDVSYDDCIEDGVMINGNVSIVAVVDVDLDLDDDDDDDPLDDDDDDGLAARVLVDYEGLLQLDGDIEGTCVIDAQVRAETLIFEHFASAGVSIEGTVCGHDADDVIHS